MRYNHTGETDIATYLDLESGECLAEVVEPLLYHNIGEDVVIRDRVYKVCNVIFNIGKIYTVYQLKEV